MKYTDKLQNSLSHIPSYTNIADIANLFPEATPAQDIQKTQFKRPVFKIIKASENVSGTARSFVPNSPDFEAVATSIMRVLQDQPRKIGPLSLEERKAKILKYRQKRAKRKYARKSEYSIRRQVAEKRNRVQGRFAGNFLSERSDTSSMVIREPKKSRLSQTGMLPVVLHPVFRYIKTAGGTQ